MITSETLANVDAILFVSATRCLYQDPRGETIYLAIEVGGAANCITSSSFQGHPTF